MTQTALADTIDRPVSKINEIAQDKRSITARTAIQFESVLGIPALDWLVIQAKYQLAQVRSGAD
jgi:addiction module HigA family antidote